MSPDPQNDPIVWYPGSGRDVGLCFTDIDDNPIGLHLRRPDGSGDVRLWMSDYHPDVEAEMSREAPVVYGFESPGWKQQFGVSGLQCRKVDTLVSAEWSQARQKTGELRRATDRLRTADDPKYDRATLEVEVERRSQRERGPDRYEVWFSPYESRAMIRHVLAPGQFSVVALVLLNVGSFDARPPGPSHHDPPFFDQFARDLGLPEFVLTDKEPGDRSPWTRRPYEFTGNALQGWKREPATVSLYRRRD